MTKDEQIVILQNRVETLMKIVNEYAARTHEVLRAAQTENMARLSASELACYRWPEDTVEHKALRAAYMDGAASMASAVSAASAEVVQTQDDIGALLHAAEAEIERLRDERAINYTIKTRQTGK